MNRPCCHALIALLALATAPGLLAQEALPEAAAEWLGQARALFQSGALGQAEEFASRALEFHPDWSDALYLRALIALGDPATTRQAISELSAAVKTASWTSVDPDEAATLLGEQLARTRQYPEAARILGETVSRRPELSRPLLALARTYEASGRSGEALAVCDRGYRLFPAESAFPVLASRILEDQGRREQALSLVSNAAALRPSDLSLALRVAELEDDPPRRIAAVERYRAAGGTDPRAAGLGLGAAMSLGTPSGADQAGKYLELFLSDGGLAREDLLEAAAAAVASDRTLSGRLATSVGSYGGSRELDADRDGWWEERWELKEGALVSWSRDENQDGVPELEETFASGKPATIAFWPEPDTRYAAFYSVYPFVERIEEASAGATRRAWLLSPRVLAIPFLPTGSANIPSTAEVLRAAFRLEERTLGGQLARSVELENGARVYLEEDANADGRIDHKLWYVKGEPDHGLRDLTGDGTFPVKESWRDGRLQSELVDTNGDLRPDYQETYLPAPARMWDYDEDGRWDSRETSGSGGLIVREFATNLDGRFDLRVVFRAGRIERIERSGRQLVATPEPERGVTWIGPVAKKAQVSAADPEGIRTFDGTRYLLFRYEGTTYLEELR